MKTWLRWTFHVANILVGGSGVVLAVMVYLLQPVDPWSVVNHPWQPLVQHAHVLAAPLMVFVFGVLWAVHVQPKWQSGAPQGRKTGLVLAAITPVMVVSGYLLQVSVEPTWHTVWEASHLVSSVFWLGVLAVHVGGRGKGERGKFEGAGLQHRPSGARSGPEGRGWSPEAGSGAASVNRISAGDREQRQQSVIEATPRPSTSSDLPQRSLSGTHRQSA